MRALADALGLDATERAAVAAAASATAAPVAAGPASDGAGGASPGRYRLPSHSGPSSDGSPRPMWWPTIWATSGSSRWWAQAGWARDAASRSELPQRRPRSSVGARGGSVSMPYRIPRRSPRQCLTASGVNETPGRPIAEQIAGAVPAEPLLLVLDNCEHLLDPVAELLGPLLATTAITVLATSRETLAIPGEVVRTVEPLALPSTGAENDVDALVEVASVQLFVERAGRARPGFAVDEHTAMAVARICRRLDGLPLAIELTAARLRGTTVMQLAEEHYHFAQSRTTPIT